MKTTIEERARTDPSRESVKSLMQIRTILVPLDFSPGSLKALSHAVALSKRFHAAVHLIHVHPLGEPSLVPNAGHLLMQSGELIERLNEELAGIHRKHLTTFYPENCHIRGGQPYQEINDVAREINADLIVISTRGQSGLKRLLLGSTVERIVRNAPCPVLVVGKGKQKPGTVRKALAIRTILVPVDFSEGSLAGVRYAALLANTFQATLRLFHALYPYARYVMSDRAGGRLASLAKADQAAAARELETLKRMDFLRDLTLESELGSGYPVDEICAAACAPDVDLIVISTHGRTGFSHALIGSVAEHVVRYAECPVLVVPMAERGRVPR